MKPPSWIKLAPKSEWRKSEDGKSVLIPMRVRWWHPGLWIEFLRRRGR